MEYYDSCYFSFSAVNTSNKTGVGNASSSFNHVTSVKSEEGVAEAWNNQRKKRETSERGMQ